MINPRPKFSLMWNSYPTESRDELFKKIGWSDVIKNPNYENTCSVRMSICLISCGIRFPAWASDNIHKRKHPLDKVRIIPEHAKLSRYLEDSWGAPDKLSRKGQQEIEKTPIYGKKGVISFFGIPGYSVGGSLGGHIDLIETRKEAVVCKGHEPGYWNAMEAWFWPVSE